MTIVPIIIIIILIYQLLASRLYDNKMEYDLGYVSLVKNSFIASDSLTKPASLQRLDELLKDFDFEGKAFYIIDDRNHVIYFKGAPEVESETYIEELNNYEFSSTSHGGLLRDNAFITYGVDEQKNKYILLTIPHLMDNKIYFIKELITIIMIVSLISMLSIILISYYLTKPIRKLSKDLEQKAIKFDEEVIIKDEIWDISIHLKKVYQELIAQNEARYYLEMKTNKAQFDALQSQINPHFLYNTLATINSIAVIEKVPLIAELSKSLANMFRYNISKNNDFVMLRDELEHIKNYLNVQLIRFEGVIKSEIQVDEVLLSSKVIKFMLQPIIENCFIHAFKDLDEEKGVVRIAVYREDASVIINVEDNGITMTQEKLERMSKLLEETEVGTINQQNQGIGLANVNTRIKLAFGKEYGLFFQHLPVKGLRVMIKIPFEAIDEGDHNVSAYDC